MRGFFIVEGKPQETLRPLSIFIGLNALIVVFPSMDFSSNKNSTTLCCIGREKQLGKIIIMTDRENAVELPDFIMLFCVWLNPRVVTYLIVQLLKGRENIWRK